MYGKDQLLFDDVYLTLLLEDSKKMIKKTKPISTALIVERGWTRDRSGNGKGRGGSKGRSKSRRRFQHDKKEIECWKRSKMSHMKKDCRDKAKASKASSSQAIVAANRMETDLLSDEDKLHAL
ncbi:hypothetical protein R1flu_018629 [Riccia fluitans]|uniref:Uncharacterized protein n=1 Tax=Riccia fluitans TaxID=41844 RepID=A0ABD1ZHW9_9MARC